jgi:hypothetical protein
MTAPPKTKNPGVVNRGVDDKKLLKLLPCHGAFAIPIGWQTEAQRLFREFWRTGNQTHLTAFVTHVTAMRALSFGEAST